MSSASSTDSARQDVLRYDQITRALRETPELTHGDIKNLDDERRSILSRYDPSMRLRISDARRRPDLIKELGASSLANIQSAQERERLVARKYPVSEILERALQPPEAPITGLPAKLGWKNAEPSTGEQLGRFWNEFTGAPLSVIGELGVQSLPTTAAALAAGAVTRSPLVSMGVMSGLSGLQEYGGTLNELLRDKGVDTTKPEAVLAALRDPVMGPELRSGATAKAVPVAFLDAVAMRLAGVTMAPRSMSPIPRHLLNVPAQVAAQGALGGTGEALGQLGAYGRIKSAGEVAAEVVAEAFSAPVEVMGVRGAMRQAASADADAAAPRTAARAVSDYLNRLVARNADPATAPTAPAPPANTVPPEIARIIEASGIMPGSPLYQAAANAIMGRLQAQAVRPAPDAFNVPPQGQGPAAAAKSVDTSVDAQRRALEAETLAREAMGAGMATYTDPATGQETSVARAAAVPRTAPPPVIALPASPDFVPGRNQEETARVEQIRNMDTEAAAAQERGAAEALLRFISTLESPPVAEPVRNDFTYADEARRPLNASETLESPAAMRMAEAQGIRPDQPISSGAAAALNRFGAAEGQRQAKADQADRELGPFTVSDTSASKPVPGLGTNPKSPPMDAERILRERAELQREYEFALGQATNQTITDTERAKWRKKAETIKVSIDGLSDKLAKRAQTAGEFENKAAKTKEQVLDKEGASVQIGTSDRPFRTKSTRNWGAPRTVSNESAAPPVNETAAGPSERSGAKASPPARIVKSSPDHVEQAATSSEARDAAAGSGRSAELEFGRAPAPHLSVAAQSQAPGASSSDRPATASIQRDDKPLASAASDALSAADISFKDGRPIIHGRHSIEEYGLSSSVDLKIEKAEGGSGFDIKRADAREASGWRTIQNAASFQEAETAVRNFVLHDWNLAQAQEQHIAATAPKAGGTAHVDEKSISEYGYRPEVIAAIKQFQNDRSGLKRELAAARENVSRRARQLESNLQNSNLREQFELAAQRLADLEDAREYLDQSDVEREASAIAHRMYTANPLDPAVVKAAMGALARLGRRVNEGIARELQTIGDHFSQLWRAMRANRGTGRAASALNFFRSLAYSNDGMLAVLARQYRTPDGKPNPHIEAFRKLWFADPGRPTAAVSQTYGEAVAERTQTRLNALVELFAPLKSKPADVQKTSLELIARRVRSGVIPATPTTEIDKIAAGLRDFFKEELRYQRGAGLDVGEVRNGYLPRVLDQSIVFARSAEFIAKATRAYRQAGLAKDEAEARKMAEAWFERIRERDLGINVEGRDFAVAHTSSGRPNSEQNRVFAKAADQLLADFYVQNPMDLAAHYTVRTTRRAELAKRLGVDLEKWIAFKKNLVDTKADAAIPEIVEIIRSATGMIPPPRSSGFNKVLSGLRLWSVLDYLERATLTSLTEPFVISSRAAGLSVARELIPIDAAGSWLRTINNAVKLARGKKSDAIMLAEDLGMIGTPMHNELMSQRFGGMNDTKFAQTILAGFFKKTGLHDFTDGSATEAARVGQIFIRRLAERALSQTDSVLWGNRKTTELFLGELGVPDDQIQDFARWVQRFPNGIPDGDSISLESAQTSKMARLYRTAMTRFRNQSIMRPNAIEKPRYASHPVGSLFYNLMSFLYAFHKNVVNRSLSLAKEASIGSGYSAAERIRLMAPLVKLAAVVVPAQYALTFLRDWAFDDPDRDPEKKRRMDKPHEEFGLMSNRWWLALSRSGMLGIWDVPMNWIGSTRYNKDPATVMAGPILGAISEMIDVSLGMVQNNSANTNTAERNLARTLYDHAVSPLINAVLSTMPGKVLGMGAAAGIQVTSSPQFRSNVTGAFGPPRWQLEQRSNSRDGRDALRGSGRAPGRDTR